MKKVEDKFYNRRGLESDNVSQKNANSNLRLPSNKLFGIDYELSSVCSKVSGRSNKVVNQKFFYFDNNSVIKVNKFVTLKKIKIKEEEKIKLKKYLKEKKISIKYFENFEGYINLARVQ
jgi:hypothetical protein